jgi:hypothetical protein
MTLEAIIRAIQTYFNASWTATPVTFGNLDPANQTRPWVCCFILPGQTSEGEVGEGGVDKRPGVVKVQVFTAAGEGVQVGAALADQVESLFRKKDVEKVHFEKPYTTDSGVRGEDQQHTVTCPWWAWTGA